jgi:hypothetical protein
VGYSENEAVVSAARRRRPRGKAAKSNAFLRREARKPYREPRAKTKRPAPTLDEPLLSTQVLYQLDDAISLVICAKVATDVVTMDREALISAGHVGVVLEHACTALRAAYDRVDRALGRAS